MPFGIFQGAVEEMLGRPVYTHEFAEPENLRKEYLGERKAPTIEEIIGMMPAAKTIIIPT